MSSQLKEKTQGNSEVNKRLFSRQWAAEAWIWEYQRRDRDQQTEKEVDKSGDSLAYC